MNENPSPEFENEIRESLSAPQADPAFVRDLRVTLLERSKMKKQNRSYRRLAWGFAIAILLIAALITSPRVVVALKQLFGYVPGVGFVRQESSSLSVLSAPATIEKDGLKVTVEKGVADVKKTVLFERIDGYPPVPPDGYPVQTCEAYPRLILPDGTILHGSGHATSQDDSKGSFYSVTDTFEGLPAGQMDAILEIPCVMFDANFTDFKLQLHFQIADETQVLPAIELPTAAPTNPAPQTGSIAGTAPAAESTVEGFSIVLESETPLADGLILAGYYEWTDPRFDGFSVQPDDPRITDANGKQLKIEPVDSVLTNDDPAIKKLPFAYKIIGKDYASPLTIAVKSLIINNLPGEGTFQFDMGANPQTGQVWNVNIDVPVAGHTVNVQTIKLIEGRTPTELGFEFTMTSDSEVLCADITDANPIIKSNSGIGGGGGGGGGFDCGSALVPFTTSWAMEGYSPAGIKTFVISGLSAAFHGIWQETTQPSTP